MSFAKNTSVTPNAGDALRRTTFAGRFRRIFLRPEAAAAAGFIVVFVGFSLGSNLFLDKATFVSITNITAELGIVAIGMTLLMIGGHFDLSIGAVLGITSYIVVTLMNNFGFPPVFAFLGALVFACVLGLINGLVVVKTGLNAFIVTLGTMYIYRGLLTAWSGGFPVSVVMPEPIRSIVAGAVLGGFRMSLLWFVLVVALATWLLLHTRLGNWIFALGQNPEAARNLGVPVQTISIGLFVGTAFCAGLAGCIQVARFQSVDALRGEGMELLAIAVTVIGGTLLTGGYGSAIGTMFGALIFGTVQVGLVLVRAPGFYFKTLVGATLVGAVLVNTLVRRRVARMRTTGEEDLVEDLASESSQQ
jgi:simple sugar transport system permease protein